MTNENSETTPAVHPFTRSGMGEAPFRYLGPVYQDMAYGEVILNRANYEKTGIRLTTKPGGTCDHCGTAILKMFRIESADGKRSVVGCDCVRKVASEANDARMLAAIKRDTAKAAKAKREAAKAKRAANQADLRAQLLAYIGANELALRSAPHSLPWMCERGMTRLDELSFLAANAGADKLAETLAAI